MMAVVKGDRDGRNAMVLTGGSSLNAKSIVPANEVCPRFGQDRGRVAVICSVDEGVKLYLAPSSNPSCPLRLIQVPLGLG